MFGSVSRPHATLPVADHATGRTRNQIYLRSAETWPMCLGMSYLAKKEAAAEVVVDGVVDTAVA